MTETIELEIMEETLDPRIVQKGAVLYKRRAMIRDKEERKKLKGSESNYWLKRILEEQKTSKTLHGYRVDRAARPEQPVNMSESYDDSDYSVTDNIMEDLKDIPVTANCLDSLVGKELTMHDEIISMFNAFSNAIPSKQVIVLPDPENRLFLRNDRNRLYGMDILSKEQLSNPDYEMPLNF